uniref:Intron-encoded endonuclease aI1 n=1 Tax=Ophiocordycipitaceae sp. TaxID=1907519 RepID=A0A6M8PG01_9HYPO|nr:intron-encoded endonuclease aI1 [Ophiocordycipitaceae sp.]QKG63784.1 intron-encoded endonuclease aI1 [Ophiocordycipitaceae sp.]
MTQTWAGKDTKSVFNECCTVCGSTSFVEMHHIRSVNKIRAGDKVTFAEFLGAIMRKQVPLCSYHHGLLHKGQLN